jgi:site-specific DNA recombinase
MAAASSALVLGEAAVLGPRSTALNEERKQVATELSAEPPAADVISLHPALLARYEQQLVHQQDALSRGLSAGDSEATEAVSGRRAPCSAPLPHHRA